MNNDYLKRNIYRAMDSGNSKNNFQGVNWHTKNKNKNMQKNFAYVRNKSCRINDFLINKIKLPILLVEKIKDKL